MKLQPHETDLVGEWIPERGTVHADDICRRIEWLVREVLEEVAVSPQWGAWETLFRDPSDGRYWERTYPKGEMHGGGPPRLTCISAEQAKAKYGDVV
jgi:hypothetical protein